MADRLRLQTILEEKLGNRNVYYRPPANIDMSYPAIVYSRVSINTKKANNNTYKKTNKYDIIVIDRKPDNKTIDKILELPYSSYNRQYISDNLYHDVITLYF